jgi:hypothetical protein
MPPKTLLPAVHQVRVLGPHVRRESQRLEIWLVAQPHRTTYAVGSVSFSLEGYTSDSVEMDMEVGLGVGADAVQSVLEALPRVGAVTVTKSVRTEYSDGISHTANMVWAVQSLDITFDARDDVPQLNLDYTQVSGLVTGDRFALSTVIEGGSDSSVSEVQIWGVSQGTVVREVEEVRLSVPTPVLEVQTIRLSADATITGTHRHIHTHT